MDSEDGEFFIKVGLPIFPNPAQLRLTTFCTATCHFCAHPRKGPCQCLAVSATECTAPWLLPERIVGGAGSCPVVADRPRTTLYISIDIEHAGRSLVAWFAQLYITQCQVGKAGSHPPSPVLPAVALRGIGHPRWADEDSPREPPRQYHLGQLCLIPQPDPALQEPQLGCRLHPFRLEHTERHVGLVLALVQL